MIPFVYIFITIVDISFIGHDLLISYTIDNIPYGVSYFYLALNLPIDLPSIRYTDLFTSCGRYNMMKQHLDYAPHVTP